jgi:CRP/FNR family cyclic AMP-dependent transcriptional regulator
MDEPAQQAFKHFARRRRLSADQIIYSQGEPGQEMFRLISGSVRVSVARGDGRTLVFLLFEPGDCFGDSSLIDQGPRPQTTQAQTDIVIDVLSLAGFQQLRAEHRCFEDAVMRLLARQMRAVSTFYAQTSLDDLPSRVAHRLLTAAQSFGAQAEGGVRLSLRLSQSDIADMVGASRQSVNKVLQRFQHDGLITIEYGNILLHDIAGMQRAATVT